MIGADKKLKKLVLDGDVTEAAFKRAIESLVVEPLDGGGFAFDFRLPDDDGVCIEFDNEGVVVAAWWQVGDIDAWREWSSGDGGE